MSLQWCDEAAKSIAELFSEEKANVDYVLFHLDNPKKSPKMELLSMGKGGRSQVETLLLPETDKVITGAFLASAIDERGSVVSVRRKYIHVVWVGTRVGIMIKGKVNTSLTQPFKDMFPGCAMYLQLSDGDLDDLQAEMLERTLLAAGGAHKPTRYSFTNRTLIGTLQLDDSSFNDEQRRREEDERRQAALAEARRKAAEAEAKRKADAEAKRLAEEEARRQAEKERREAEELRMATLRAEEELRKARELEEEEARRRKAKEDEQKLKTMTPKAALSDKSLIMLISSMSGNMATSSNQALAKSMLEGLDVIPEVIDGAEPANKEIRNNLFAISGLRGKYPQFFLRKSDGEIKFFGDYETLAHYNDTGTLAEHIGGCATPTNQSANDTEAPVPSVEVTLNGNKLLLLVSSMSGDLTVSSNQARVESILKGMQLPKEELEIMDGCDQALKDRRNELFGISGIRAKYPQLFLVSMSTGATTFIGTYDDISHLHDTNTLGKAVGLVTKSAKPKPTVVSTLHGNKLQLLISSMPGNLEVSSNQTRVQGILSGLHLSKDEVEVLDGCDPALKDRRNELFGISGIRAKYPQLFLVNKASGETKFVGNYDDISYLHDTNTFSQAVGLVTKSTASVDSAAAPATAITTATGGVQENQGRNQLSPPPLPQLSSPPNPRMQKPQPVKPPSKEESLEPAKPNSTEPPEQKVQPLQSSQVPTTEKAESSPPAAELKKSKQSLPQEPKQVSDEEASPQPTAKLEKTPPIEPNHPAPTHQEPPNQTTEPTANQPQAEVATNQEQQPVTSTQTPNKTQLSPVEAEPLLQKDKTSPDKSLLGPYPTESDKTRSDPVSKQADETRKEPLVKQQARAVESQESQELEQETPNSTKPEQGDEQLISEPLGVAQQQEEKPVETPQDPTVLDRIEKKAQVEQEAPSVQEIQQTTLAAAEETKLTTEKAQREEQCTGPPSPPGTPRQKELLEANEELSTNPSEKGLAKSPPEAEILKKAPLENETEGPPSTTTKQEVTTESAANSSEAQTSETKPLNQSKASPPAQERETTEEAAPQTETAKTPDELPLEDSCNKPELTTNPESASLEKTESSPKTETATTDAEPAEPEMNPPLPPTAPETTTFPPTRDPAATEESVVDPAKQLPLPATSVPPPSEERSSEPKPETPSNEAASEATIQVGKDDGLAGADPQMTIDSVASEVTAADLPTLVASESDLTEVKPADVGSP